MSIIADTLKRLQADSTGTVQGTDEESSGRHGITHEDAARHLKSSETKLGRIAIGITIGLTGLALVAFWTGGHLDIGFSTNSHSSPISPLAITVEGTTATHLKTAVVAVSTPIQAPNTPPALANNENLPPALIAAIDSTSINHALPSSTQGSSTSSLMIPSKESRVNTPEFPPSANNDKEYGLKKSQSKKPSAVLSSIKQPPPKEKPLRTDRIKSQATDKGKAAHPVASTMKGELHSASERIKTRKPGTGTTQTKAALSTLQARSETRIPAVPTAVSLQASSADRLIRGQQFIRTGKYDDAVALLSPLFHDPPVNWQPWFWMGTALLGKGETEQADQFFLSGLARNDKIPELWIQRALVAQQRGDYQLAIHELRQAESLKADLPHIPLNLGYAYEQLGNHQLANQYYGKFLQLSEGKENFFPIRKKLFSRLTQQTPAKPSSASSTKQ